MLVKSAALRKVTGILKGGEKPSPLHLYLTVPGILQYGALGPAGAYTLRRHCAKKKCWQPWGEGAGWVP